MTLPLKEIIRIVNEEDEEQYYNNERDAEQALELCKKVKNQNLDMRLVNCEYTLDKSKVIFNFTADDRIDFRKLVKVLAQNLKLELNYVKLG